VAVAFVAILVFLAYPKRQHHLFELLRSTSSPQLEFLEQLDQPSCQLSYL